MLEHQQAPVEAQEIPSLIAPLASNTSVALPPQTEALIARYAAQQEADQQGVTRTRLEELIAAHLELDATPEEAARSAIQQLENERLAAQQRRETAKQQAFRQRPRTPTAKRSTRPATLLALKMFGGGALALVAGMTALFTGRFTPGGMPISVLQGICLFMYFGLPIALGNVVGRRIRHRPGLGTFYAVAMLAPLVAIVSEVVMRVLLGYTYGAWALGLVVAICWLPLGTATAALTGWSRDLNQKRRRDAANRANNRVQTLGAES